jgi:putative oxidoreductase
VNIGLLILRVVVGALFIGHGTQKLFGWFGGHGPEGAGRFLEQVGYRPGRPLAIVAGVAEAGGGLLLLLGLLTPLGSAAIIGVMVSASVAVHLPNGLWNTEGGFELPLVNGASAAALAFIGPGLISMDETIGWDLDGALWGLAAVVLGTALALALLGWRSIRIREQEAAHARRSREAA